MSETPSVEKDAGQIDALRIGSDDGTLTFATRHDGQIEAQTSGGRVVFDREAVVRLADWLTKHDPDDEKDAGLREQITVVLAEHTYVPSLARGVSRCACGEQMHGMPHDHRRHVVAALTAAGIGVIADAKAEALLPIRRFAEAGAISAKALGRNDRDFLDLMILCDRAEAHPRPCDCRSGDEHQEVCEGREGWADQW